MHWSYWSPAKRHQNIVQASHQWFSARKTSVGQQWSYVFLALTHRNLDPQSFPGWVNDVENNFALWRWGNQWQMPLTSWPGGWDTIDTIAGLQGSYFLRPQTQVMAEVLQRSGLFLVIKSIYSHTWAFTATKDHTDTNLGAIPWTKLVLLKLYLSYNANSVW